MRIRYRKLWHRACKALLRLRWYSAAGYWMSLLATGFPKPHRRRPRTVLIGGVSRIGKSTVAMILADRFGYRHVDLDPFLHHAYRIDDARARAAYKNAFYSRLLSSSAGYAIEGDDLVMEDRWYDSGEFGKEPVTLSRLLALGEARGIPSFVLGTSDGPTDSRLALLEDDPSWVASLDAAARKQYAGMMLKQSAVLRELARNTSVTYLELGAGSEHAAACAEQIAMIARDRDQATR